MALNAHSGETTFEEICSKFVFIIPPEQREFVWDNSDVRALISDVFEHFIQAQETFGDEEEDGVSQSSGKYIGAIIGLIVERFRHSELSLYDGQQRVTTLLIFMNALSLALAKRGVDEEDCERLKVLRGIFIKDHRVPQENNVLKTVKVPVLRPHYDYEVDFFKKLQEGKVDDYRKRRSRKSFTKLENAFRECEAFIKDNFENTDEGDTAILGLMDYIANSIEITLVTRDCPEVARKVFLSLNSTGKSLESLDLFRGYLVGDAGNTPEQRQDIIDTWNNIFCQFKGDMKGYQDFITCYVNSIRNGAVLFNKKKESGFIKYSDIYKACFVDGQQIIGQEPSSLYPNSISCIQDISRMFNIYRHIENGNYIERDGNISLYSLIYKNRGVVVHYHLHHTSLISCLARHFPTHIDTLFDLVARHVLLCRLYYINNETKGHTSPYNKVFNKVRNKVISGEYDLQSTIKALSEIKHAGETIDENILTSAMISSGNKTIKDSLIRFIYTAVERRRGYDLQNINDSFHVEHCSPQTRHETFTNDFGNLLLLEADLNIAASDKDLVDKQNQYYLKSSLFLTRLMHPNYAQVEKGQERLTSYEEMIVDAYNRLCLRHGADMNEKKWNAPHIAARSELYMFLLSDILSGIKEKALSLR